MQWDLIIGNPPYQLNDAKDKSSATPIYNKFVEQAKKLQPKYLTMIIPARWMTGGKGLGSFRNVMLNDKHITKLHDYLNSGDCFSGVDIPGGICYFLREKDLEAQCEITTVMSNGIDVSCRYLNDDGIHIRIQTLNIIKNKIWGDRSEKSFELIVSAGNPYGIRTDFLKNQKKYNLPYVHNKKEQNDIAILGIVENKRTYRYVDADYPLPKIGFLDKYKIIISSTYGCAAIGEKENTPVLGELTLGYPNMACTETFIEIGGWASESEMLNAEKYLKTKFLRSMLGICKQTQRIISSSFKYVPLQDFTEKSDIDWGKSVEEINQQLYKKYGLSEEDIKFIEDNIEPMD